METESGQWFGFMVPYLDLAKAKAELASVFPGIQESDFHPVPDSGLLIVRLPNHYSLEHFRKKISGIKSVDKTKASQADIVL